jgi:hypothetical protein
VCDVSDGKVAVCMQAVTVGWGVRIGGALVVVVVVVVVVGYTYLRIRNASIDVTAQGMCNNARDRSVRCQCGVRMQVQELCGVDVVDTR